MCSHQPSLSRADISAYRKNGTARCLSAKISAEEARVSLSSVSPFLSMKISIVRFNTPRYGTFANDFANIKRHCPDLTWRYSLSFHVIEIHRPFINFGFRFARASFPRLIPRDNKSSDTAAFLQSRDRRALVIYTSNGRLDHRIAAYPRTYFTTLRRTCEFLLPDSPCGLQVFFFFFFYE